MRNWRTTVAGLLVSAPFIIDALIQAYTAGYFTDKSGLQLFVSIAFVVFARLAKDHNVSGNTKTVSASDNNGLIGGSKPPIGKDEK